MRTKQSSRWFLLEIHSLGGFFLDFIGAVPLLFGTMKNREVGVVRSLYVDGVPKVHGS